MTEPDYTHPDLSLHGRHVPEHPDSIDPAAYDVDDPVTGFYEIGVEIDGVFVPLLREKASKVLHIVAHGQKMREKSAAAGSPVEPAPAVPAQRLLTPDEYAEYQRLRESQSAREPEPEPPPPPPE